MMSSRPGWRSLTRSRGSAARAQRNCDGHSRKVLPRLSANYRLGTGELYANSRRSTVPDDEPVPVEKGVPKPNAFYEQLEQALQDGEARSRTQHQQNAGTGKFKPQEK